MAVSRPWSEEDVKKVEKLALEGASSRLIAEQFHGRTRNSVVSLCNRRGIPLTGHLNPRQEKPFIKRLEIGEEPAQVPFFNVPEVRDEGVAAVVFFPSTPLNKRRTKEIVTDRVSILRLTEVPANGCRYPTNRGDDGEWCMCAKPRAQGYFYCSEHYELCYQPNSSRKRAS